ncbi:alpha/beta fold hydrolase [Sodalis sp. RH21]|uniref:alpha/beta fold hydrolase n=1 Tax=unclassified Sodalis (in: enterobacteria) TaxID=2636512 RepID=UPI0039B3878C
MFDGFTLQMIALPEVTLRVRHGGAGPAVLLLHGHPRTHATWHRVAPLLSPHFTVICPDLRGYGLSSKPPDGDNHAGYSKRKMAQDCVALMKHLGHDRFAVVGHDRGSYVAMRAALDFPAAIERLMVLDSVPIAEALARCAEPFARRWWHWFFFAQPDKPEQAILADPDKWYGFTAGQMGEEAYADYHRAIHDPFTVHAMLEDYRAGLAVDRYHDEEDRRNGHKIRCPTRVIWSTRDDLPILYDDILGIWRNWALEVSGQGIDSGHHVAEDNPAELARQIIQFCR